jgi:hypothetical protein
MLMAFEEASLAEEIIDHSRFTMVNVGNDGYIANIFACFGHGDYIQKVN